MKKNIISSSIVILVLILLAVGSIFIYNYISSKNVINANNETVTIEIEYYKNTKDNLPTEDEKLTYNIGKNENYNYIGQLIEDKKIPENNNFILSNYGGALGHMVSGYIFNDGANPKTSYYFYYMKNNKYEEASTGIDSCTFISNNFLFSNK